MNRAIAISLFLLPLALPVAAFAQNGHAAHHSSPAAASPSAGMTNGVVKRVDKASGMVVIAHEPLANLGMPAMTMGFLVKDRAWLDEMKVGAPIRFVAAIVNGELTVVAVDRPK